MKKFILVITMMCAFVAFASAQESDKEKKFEFTDVESYDLSGNMPSRLVSEVGVNYKFNSLGAVGLSAIYSDNDESTTWGIMANLSVRPKLGDKFSFIPTLGLGVLRGKFDGINTKTRGAISIGVEARYNISSDFFCGFNLSAFSSGAKNYYNTMLLGVKWGFTF